MKGGYETIGQPAGEAQAELYNPGRNTRESLFDEIDRLAGMLPRDDLRVLFVSLMEMTNWTLDDLYNVAGKMSSFITGQEPGKREV